MMLQETAEQCWYYSQPFARIELPVSNDRLPRMLNPFTRLNPETDRLLEAPLPDAISDQILHNLIAVTFTDPSLN